LLDLINRFGHFGGFSKLLARFEYGTNLNVTLILALLKPFGVCCDYLHPNVIQKFFIPIVDIVPAFLEKLSDEELKRESKNEAKNDTISGILKLLKNLASKVFNQEETLKNLELFRLRMIVRLLQVSSFNGKMNALNEVNKVITNANFKSFHQHYHHPHHPHHPHHHPPPPLPSPQNQHQHPHPHQHHHQHHHHHQHYQSSESVAFTSVSSSNSAMLSALTVNTSPISPTSRTEIEEVSSSTSTVNIYNSSPELPDVTQTDAVAPRFNRKLIQRNKSADENYTTISGERVYKGRAKNTSSNICSNAMISGEPSNNFLTIEEDNWLTPERIAKWICENNVLKIVLRDSLHQPQYVEKLEKIIRFVIKEKAFTIKDLDDLWAAQRGKHEAIVKNIHDLFAKLAWDFNPEQLDHLFECFRESWTQASKKQREKLLELIRRLAEDDKDGLMAHKFLNLLWNLAHDNDIPTDIIDQALAALIKILDHSCCQDRDSQQAHWLAKCVDELKSENSNWILPALKLIKEICCLYNDASSSHPVSDSVSNESESVAKNFHISTVGTENTLSNNMNSTQQPLTGDDLIHLTSLSSEKLDKPSFLSLPSNTSNSHHISSRVILSRHEVIYRLQLQHSLVETVSENFSKYITKVRQSHVNDLEFDAHKVYPHKRYSHAQEVEERLNFLKFLLKEGRFWLCTKQATQIWKCLVENVVFLEDREICFRWFSQLMSEEQDLDPVIIKSFYEDIILNLDPSLITESGVDCFDRFFKAVNLKEGKLIIKKASRFTCDFDLIGLDYLWKIIIYCNDNVASKGITLMTEIFTNISPSLAFSVSDVSSELIKCCMEKLKSFYQTVTHLMNDKASQTQIEAQIIKIIRVLKLLCEYIKQCDNKYGDERSILPLEKSYRGKQLSLKICFRNYLIPLNSVKPLDHFQIVTHRNEYMSSIKRQILNK